MRQRVRRQIDLGQLRTIDMRVDLRGRYIGMSQDLLQHTEVCAARKHMGGKGVTQRMGMESHQSHLVPVALTDGMDALARQTAAVLI